MYAIYAYIDPQNHPNVGIYDRHGVSGFGLQVLIFHFHVMCAVHVLFRPSRVHSRCATASSRDSGPRNDGSRCVTWKTSGVRLRPSKDLLHPEPYGVGLEPNLPKKAVPRFRRRGRRGPNHRTSGPAEPVSRQVAGKAVMAGRLGRWARGSPVETRW